MSLVSNEMLRDSAVLLTSRNPSLSSRSCAHENELSAILASISNLLPAEQNHASTSTQTSRNGSKSNKSKTPRRKKPKSPSAINAQSDEPLQRQQSISAANIAHVDASQNKSRRNDVRTFRPSNQPSTSKASRPKNGNSVEQQVSPIQPMKSFGGFPMNNSNNFRRYPNVTNSNYSNRFFFSAPSDLNPFARSFVPRQAKPGTSNEFVSREIFDYYQRNRQSNELFKSKQIMRQSLENILKQNFPNHVINLYMVGSSTNGIGDNASSVDICILARKRTPESKADQTKVSTALSKTPVALADAKKLKTEAADDHEPSLDKSQGEIQEIKPQEKEANLDVQAKSALIESNAFTVSSTLYDSASKGSSTDVAVKKSSESETSVKLEAKDGAKITETKNVAKSTETKEVDKSLEAKNVAKSPELKAAKISSKATKVSVEAVISEKVNSENKHNVARIDLKKSQETKAEPTINNEPELTLSMIEQLLRGKNFAKDIVSIPAKVPIIKFKDDISKLDITLNLNQDASIRNTQLIRDYAKMDWRFSPLAMILKQWARENRIASAIDKTISSYSWTLMVIHYLQVCDPPVLPCLQKMLSRRYDQRNTVEQAISNWRRYPTRWRSNNTQNLRQLLKGLLRYYGYTFRYDQHVISIREGRLLDRSSFVSGDRNLDPSTPPVATIASTNQYNAFLCVEEPFTRVNCTRSVHDKKKFERIIELLRMSSNALRGVRISVFSILADDLSFPINY